jgi:hypothetical protein
MGDVMTRTQWHEQILHDGRYDALKAEFGWQYAREDIVVALADVRAVNAQVGELAIRADAIQTQLMIAAGWTNAEDAMSRLSFCIHTPEGRGIAALIEQIGSICAVGLDSSSSSVPYPLPRIRKSVTQSRAAIRKVEKLLEAHHAYA